MSRRQDNTENQQSVMEITDILIKLIEEFIY